MRKLAICPVMEVAKRKFSKLRKITVQVKACDIKNGQAKSCTRCPIALAMIRRLGIKGLPVPHLHPAWVREPFMSVDEARSEFRIRAKAPVISARMPQSVTTFIRRYDTYKTVKPFQFNLTLRPQST